mmetsp:Transcript_30029/g.101234  ORF Transcript_30029/g.101234 Transcript_30029/m.101234 type:complete len:519 (+) Transcript_30029:575-2131(+)
MKSRSCPSPRRTGASPPKPSKRRRRRRRKGPPKRRWRARRKSGQSSGRAAPLATARARPCRPRACPARANLGRSRCKFPQTSPPSRTPSLGRAALACTLQRVPSLAELCLAWRPFLNPASCASCPNPSGRRRRGRPGTRPKRTARTRRLRGRLPLGQWRGRRRGRRRNQLLPEHASPQTALCPPIHRRCRAESATCRLRVWRCKSRRPFLRPRQLHPTVRTAARAQRRARCRAAPAPCCAASSLKYPPRAASPRGLPPFGWRRSNARLYPFPAPPTSSAAAPARLERGRAPAWPRGRARGPRTRAAGGGCRALRGKTRASPGVPPARARRGVRALRARRRKRLVHLFARPKLRFGPPFPRLPSVAAPKAAPARPCARAAPPLPWTLPRLGAPFQRAERVPQTQTPAAKRPPPLSSQKPAASAPIRADAASQRRLLLQRLSFRLAGGKLLFHPPKPLQTPALPRPRRTAAAARRTAAPLPKRRWTSPRLGLLPNVNFERRPPYASVIRPLIPVTPACSP